MAQSIDFYIDVTNGTLVAAGSARDGSLPTLTRNDSYNFRVRLQERDTTGLLRDLDTASSSVKLGIGGVDDGPTSGAFKLVINGVTSNAITYSSDEATVASSIYTAVSNNVATVTTYGNEPDAYVLTATASNTAMSFGGSSFTLFPTTSVNINTRRFPAPSVAAQQVVRLIRSPAVYSDTFVASSTAGIVALTKLQDGSATQNEIYSLSVGRDAEGGSVILNYGANSTTAIPVGSSAASFSEALSAVTGIGVGNISVDVGNNAGNYSISFVRDLGLQDVTTAFILDASGVIFGSFLQTTVTLATAELDELFAEAGTDTIIPTIEIELTQSGTPKTVLQSPITVRRDLITTGSVVPGAQASYYTKAEVDAGFLTSAVTAFLSNSTNGFNSSGFSRSIFSSTGATRFSSNLTGIGFFATTPVGRPANINAVSGLINLGLLATGVSYGVLPQSPYTVTTLTSVTFGTVAGNDQHYRDVVVTGASVNDIVLVGLPSAISAGAIIQGVAYKANTVCLSCVNADSVSRDVNTATYRITVIGY
jgi:hypothetical protein